MSDIPDGLRAAITARAGDACEYCLLPAQWQVGTFPIDHILPRSSGGRTELDNLALTCPHCNAHKWAHLDGFDATSGRMARLFHPRTDVWHEHFAWSADSCEFEGKTPSGRATVDRLRMNDANVVLIRRLLVSLNLLSVVNG